jgi:hypothetical protein
VESTFVKYTFAPRRIVSVVSFRAKKFARQTLGQLGINVRDAQALAGARVARPRDTVPVQEPVGGGLSGPGRACPERKTNQRPGFFRQTGILGRQEFQIPGRHRKQTHGALRLVGDRSAEPFGDPGTRRDEEMSDVT